MPAFLIADVDVKDPYAYEAYKAANPAIVRKFGGRYIARGGAVKVLEGDWQPRRAIVIEFPDMAAVDAFSDSPEYTNLRKIRHQSADSRLVVMETLEVPIE